MCAQFELKAEAEALEKLFGISLPDNLSDLSDTPFSSTHLHKKITPHQKSWVVTADGFKEMNFSLIPSWSKERKPKFATHNARLETLAEKPTWKKPLESKRCLVPLTSFIEPIYHNEYAGNMVAFSSAEKTQPVMVAAGIYDEWLDKSTGEVIESFTIITREPIDFVKKIGHDRSPLFLNAENQKQWIDGQKKPAGELIDFLRHSQAEPSLEVQKDRAMRPGWEKRR